MFLSLKTHIGRIFSSSMSSQVLKLLSGEGLFIISLEKLFHRLIDPIARTFSLNFHFL